MKNSNLILACLLITALLFFPSACALTPLPTPTATAVYSLYQLEYRLIAHYPDIFWWDPDYYPIGRPGQEEKNAVEQFATIKANAAEFAAILENLGLLSKADYTDAEKLAIYREHKELTYAVQMAASGNINTFTLRTGETPGYRIEGLITSSGKITEVKRETSFNTWPICLTRGTLVDTPAGLIPVEQIEKDMTVWTVSELGERIVATVVETAMTPVPANFRMKRVILDDGRSLTASPGHPTAAGRPLGGYQVGDTMDGALVTAVEDVEYHGKATYDILPAGKTGLYWANGILLKSTLAIK